MKTYRTLLIDDNSTSANLARYYLDQSSCVVVHVASGEQGLEELLNYEVDLIILDWKMPNLGGREMLLLGDDLLTQLQRSTVTKIPVLIYTEEDTRLIQIPKTKHFSIRSTLSKKLSPHRQLLAFRKVLSALPVGGHL